jgi:ribonuclease P protein component
VLRHLARPDGTEPDAPAVRLAVVASRAVGGAVQRNRAKRLLREAARAQVWRSGHDIVLVARPACAASGLHDVVAELRRLGSALDVLDHDLDHGGGHDLDRDEGPTP